MAEAANEDERFRVKVDGPEGAPVILMSHSLGCDLTMWDDVVPALAQKYRVVRYDTRGHGGSVVVERPTSIAELADDALAILDGLGVERAHFVGLSMGGMIGQWLLRHAPERLDRVVLCNTAATMAPAELWNARIRTARESGMAALTPATMERWFTPEFRAGKPEGLARVARMFEATSPEGYASCCAAIRDMDQRWPLRAAIGDVTVLVGARDPGTTPQMGRLIADAIPGARLVSVDTAHISAVERPDQVADAILAALAAPARKTPRAAARKLAPLAPRKPAPAARVAARSPVSARRAAPGVKTPSKATPAKPEPGKTAPVKTTATKATATKMSAAKKERGETADRVAATPAARVAGSRKPVANDKASLPARTAKAAARAKDAGEATRAIDKAAGPPKPAARTAKPAKSPDAAAPTPSASLPKSAAPSASKSRTPKAAPPPRRPRGRST